MQSSYDSDFYSWTQETAEKLRRGEALGSSDLQNIVQEIEDLGKAEYKSLRSALRELIVHRLWWDYQRAKRSPSWRRSIN